MNENYETIKDEQEDFRTAMGNVKYVGVHVASVEGWKHWPPDLLLCLTYWIISISLTILFQFFDPL
jgi:hypothetical protein